MNSNREILAAVLLNWLQPLLGTIAASRFSSIPGVANIESKIKSTGWVDKQWTLGADLSPYITGIASGVIGPMLSEYLSNVPDEAIPAVAHNVVDTALTNGELSLFGGNITFDKQDLQRLKRLLNANLSNPIINTYNVKEDEK